MNRFSWTTEKSQPEVSQHFLDNFWKEPSSLDDTFGSGTDPLFADTGHSLMMDLDQVTLPPGRMPPLKL